MLQDSTEEQSSSSSSSSSKRGRYEYRDGSGPSSGQPPPSYSAQRPSTQTLTISDISNASSSSLGPSTSGPLITALPDDDTISHARPVIRFPEESVPSSQPIVSSPVSTSATPSYPQASVVHAQPSMGVVTFPEEQTPTTVVHPSHVAEPQQNFIGDQVDYISQNLDNIQYQLTNHPLMMDNSFFYDIFGHEGVPPGQDPLDLLADRAAASPLPGHTPSQGHELVQYGMQGSGANSSSPRGHPRSREREDQYGRREWAQGQQHPDYDVVQHLFNG